MKKDAQSLRQAEKLLRLISRKFDMAEFHMRANSRRLEELGARKDALRNTFHRSLSPSSVQTAMHAIPNWRRMATMLKAEHAEEDARLQVLRRACEDELAATLRQREALSSYFKKQKRRPD